MARVNNLELRFSKFSVYFISLYSIYRVFVQYITYIRTCYVNKVSFATHFNYTNICLPT